MFPLIREIFQLVSNKYPVGANMELDKSEHPSLEPVWVTETVKSIPKSFEIKIITACTTAVMLP
jgi:hypothetical protein